MEKCIFTVISTDDPSDPAENREYLKKAKADNAGAVIADSVEAMVDGILKKMANQGCPCIKGLRIIGHGSEGKIIIGKGRAGDDPKKRINGDKSEWEEQLKRLQKKFCKKAKVEFLACWFGAGDKGAKKLSLLADFLDVTTSGWNIPLKPGGYPDESKKGAKEVIAKPKKPAKKVDRVESRLPRFASSIPALLPPARGQLTLALASGLDTSIERALRIDDPDDIRNLLGEVDMRSAVDARLAGGLVDAVIYVVVDGAIVRRLDVTDSFRHIGVSGVLSAMRPISRAGSNWLRQLTSIQEQNNLGRSKA